MSIRAGCYGLALMMFVLVLASVSETLSAQHRAELVQLPVRGMIGNIKSSAAVRPDPDGRLEAQALMQSDAGFGPYRPELESSAPPLWLKLSLAAPLDADGRYVLRVARRFFEAFDVYVPQPDGGLARYSAAYQEAATVQTVGRHYTVDFWVPPGQSRTLLIRVDTLQDSLGPLELWIEDGDSFSDSKVRSFLLFGLLFGVLIALIFHNLVLYLNLRQRGHLFYVLAMASLLLFLGVDSGLLQGYLLPGSLLAQVSRMYILLSVAVLITSGLFFLAFVNPRRHAPRVTRVVQVGLVLIGLLGLGLVFVPARHLLTVATLLQPLQLITQLLLLVGAFMAGRRGATEGYIFLAAWSVFIISGFSRVLISIELLPRTDVLEYLIYLGAVIEASILSLGLSWRVRQLYARHARALEEQHEAARLANLDPLTDAYNRRFLQTYLDKVMPGPEGDAFDRAVLILDLDDFKEINDEFGHAAGDTVLRELVKRCRRVLREGDVMCRLGGDEFVVVLSDQTEFWGLQVARRIIEEVAARPFFFEGTAMPVTTSIGVVSRIPPGCAVSDILRMADQALYQAKQAGRDRAVLFDPDKGTPFRHGPSRAVLGREA